jgi:hypothetical protein
MADETISVVVAASPAEESVPTRGGLESIDAAVVELPVSKLRENVAKECEKFMSIMSDVKDSQGYKLTEVEVGFEISGEGGVSFIGTAKVGARASLRMKFTPKIATRPARRVCALLGPPHRTFGSFDALTSASQRTASSFTKAPNSSGLTILAVMPSLA